MPWRPWNLNPLGEYPIGLPKLANDLSRCMRRPSHERPPKTLDSIPPSSPDLQMRVASTLSRWTAIFSTP